uniref:Uncharacterized protein n=1 Tax=Ditylenchus dipsaci TaxID=166011 RepID=A0A915DPD5_9BILA
MVPFKLDVADPKTIEKSLELVETNLRQGQGLHAIVNNAGILRAGFDDWISADEYEECLKVNTFGAIRVTEKFRHLVKKEQGRIVMMSSIAGRISLPGCGPYVVSKFAVEAYADTIRRELYPFGVKVSIIEPGFHRTAITEDKLWIDLFTKAWKKAPESVKKEYGGMDFLTKYHLLLSKLLNSPVNSKNRSRGRGIL